MLCLFLLLVLQAAPHTCRTESTALLAEVRQRIAREGVRGVGTALANGVRTDPACAPLAGAHESLDGWLAARRAAAVGGTNEALAPARAAAARLEDGSSHVAWRVEGEYAAAVIRAAMAAAQDERDEMALYITHARGLSEQLALAGVDAVWPLPADVMAGELWMDVDRYEDARTAYARAVMRHPTGQARAGMARALARLGKETDACVAYRLALDAVGGPLLDEARTFLARPACAQ